MSRRIGPLRSARPRADHGDRSTSTTTTASDSSTSVIKILLYFGGKPTFSARDGKLEYVDGVPHLIRLRNDTSFDDFVSNTRLLRPSLPTLRPRDADRSF